jgi:hypothetical protein
MLSTFIFFLSQYVNELFLTGVEITGRTLTSCVQGGRSNQLTNPNTIGSTGIHFCNFTLHQMSCELTLLLI